MKERLKTGLLWFCQILAAAILMHESLDKLMGGSNSLFIFRQLEMEPFGRYLVGVLELTAAGALLTRHFAAVGALLSFATMCGALIAHVTVLGVEVKGDGGELVLELVAVLLCSSVVLYLRRKRIPLLGSSLREEEKRK